jgi:hypothetical protein
MGTGSLDYGETNNISQSILIQSTSFQKLPLGEWGSFWIMRMGPSPSSIKMMSLIHTLKHKFEGSLRPYFQLQMYREESLNPIFICPVSLR